MKKVITILAIMIVLVGAVFAADGDKLKVTAAVTKVAPTFAMYGGLDNTYGTTAGSASSTTNTIATGANPATASITVFVKIEQNVKSFYKDTTGFDLTITGSVLSLDTDSSYASDAPKATLDTKVTDTDHLTITQAGGNSDTVTYTLKYPTGVPVAASTKIGSFKFVWAAKDTLPVGNYSATITLGYTTH